MVVEFCCGFFGYTDRMLHIREDGFLADDSRAWLRECKQKIFEMGRRTEVIGQKFALMIWRQKRVVGKKNVEWQVQINNQAFSHVDLRYLEDGREKSSKRVKNRENTLLEGTRWQRSRGEELNIVKIHFQKDTNHLCWVDLPHSRGGVEN